MAAYEKLTVPRCVVCAQPAEKLKCVKCKTPYCSIACQTVDWKERGHKKECKRLVKANAAAAAKGGASRDEAQAPQPSPKPKTAPPVVDGPARGRADVASAKAAASAIAAPAPLEPEHYLGTPRCPICLEDWDVNDTTAILLCCCKSICVGCNRRMTSVDSSACPLCRTPTPKTNEEALAMIRRNCQNDNPVALTHLGSSFRLGRNGLVPSFKKAARLYRRAAGLGDVPAMEKYGWLLTQGRGVKLDRKKAVAYFRMAADRGFALGQYNLGNCGPPRHLFYLCIAETLVSQASRTASASPETRPRPRDSTSWPLIKASPRRNAIWRSCTTAATESRATLPKPPVGLSARPPRGASRPRRCSRHSGTSRLSRLKLMRTVPR